MTREQSKKFCESGWWKDKTMEQIVALQLYEPRLCMPNFSLFHEAVEAALNHPVFTHEFADDKHLQREFEATYPDADKLKAEMSALKAEFFMNLFDEQVAQLSSFDSYTSPEFQCDQTEGFPVSLCVNWEKGKAWLKLNEFFLTDRGEMEQNYFRQLCADFGIRDCQHVEQFNEILRSLGEDAIDSAELFAEEEGQGFQQ